MARKKKKKSTQTNIYSQGQLMQIFAVEPQRLSSLVGGLAADKCGHTVHWTRLGKRRLVHAAVLQKDQILNQPVAS